MDGLMQLACAEFAEILASNAPAPGGGGASAYVGALGIALGSMAGRLTGGKAKYKEVQGEIEALLQYADRLRLRLQELVAEDALAFAPLARAYGLPTGTDAEKRVKAETLEIALKAACDVPLAIMEACCEAIVLIGEFAEKGSKLAVSDAGAGAVFCKAALIGASLNVFINTKLMMDKSYAEALNAKASAMVAEYGGKADEIYEAVRGRM
ncbi:MAG: cyclodeaminase/cyclohydrolase family protein [Clostridiales Family XIII bacterium]|jgi:formiminotetrahydrofolate cyclodeaminase|nr:cyclodeaminase/cyclohydrolase family protein [Clostridiales Family XIII bacterium]